MVLDERPDVSLSAPIGRVRYELGGEEPDRSSPFYFRPVELDLRDGPVVLAARVEMPDGRLGPVRRARFSHTTPRAAALVDTSSFEPGWRVETLEGRFLSVDRMDRAEVLRRDGVDAVAIPEWAPDGEFGLRFRGYLWVPSNGVYTFRLTSDDGSVLRIANIVIVDHDGQHGATSREAQVALGVGYHPIEVPYFQIDGRRALELEWSPDGETFGTVDGRVVARVR